VGEEDGILWELKTIETVRKLMRMKKLCELWENIDPRSVNARF
jgi:hypothetical protein